MDRFGRFGTLAAVVTALFLLGSPASAQDEEKELAKEHFYKAVELYNQGKYYQALTEFETSYNIHAHWKLRYNIGMCHYFLNHQIEAAENFSIFLLEGKEDVVEALKKEAEAMLEELKKHLGMLYLVNLGKDMAVVVDGVEKAGPRPGSTVFLLPGKHRIEIRKGDELLIGETIEFEAGKTVTRNCAMVVFPEEEKGKIAALPEEQAQAKPEEKPVPAAAPSEKKKLTLAGWALFATGGGLLLAGAVTGGVALRANSLKNEAEDEYLEKLNDPSVSDAELEDLSRERDDHYDRAKSLAMSTNVLLGLGAALVATSVVLLVVGARKGGVERKSPVALGLGPGALVLDWSF